MNASYTIQEGYGFPPETVVLGRQNESPTNSCVGRNLECEFSRNVNFGLQSGF